MSTNATAPRRDIAGGNKAPAKAADEPMAPEAPAEGGETASAKTAAYKVGFYDGYMTVKESKAADPTDGIDANDPEYKSGFEAGLAAAKTPEPETPAEPAPAPSDAPPAAAKPATVQQLRSLAPDDDKFVLDCLAASMTLEASTAKYVSVLAGKFKASEAKAAKLERELAEEQRSPAPVRTPRASTAGGAKDPVAAFEAKVKSHVDGGMPRAKAMAAVIKADPEMHREYVDAVNEARRK
jgi:hypothetical protein